MEDPDKVKVEAGVAEDPSGSRLKSVKDFTCTICYSSAEDEPSGKMTTIALGCGHRFCKDCYQQYINQKVKEDGESRRVQCMEEDCKLVVDEKTVELIVEPQVFQR